MLNYDVFEKVGVMLEDIPYIMEIDKIYGEKVEQLANDYKKELCKHPFEPMDIKTLDEKLRRSKEVVTITFQKQILRELLL